MSDKKFLDTVHGYISVPESYCDKLIDTAHFQRLRRIEQTSARSLFPCAHHDRFVHSLGVYHLGRKFVNSITKQMEINHALQETFLIACLLHDCGHSPFSHTLEDLFGTTDDLFKLYQGEITNRKLDKEIIEVDISKYDTKPHEVLSSLLCVTVFYESIIELGGNPSLIGRMIMGLPYNTIDKSLEDCFISLLHGDVIDTDKLDYICRDKWASGYLADSVDLDRLIDSVVIYKNEQGRYKIAYSKSSLNEIQALIDSKNFQTNWVFKHHQVVYEQKLLKDSVQELIQSLGISNPSQLFNYKAFFGKVDVCEGVEIYLPSDDDIIHLMKIKIDFIPHLSEWLSRNYDFFPLWKSLPEMIALLDENLSKKILKDKGQIYSKICEVIKNKFDVEAFSLDATPKIKTIKEGQVTIKFDNSTYVDFSKLNMPSVENIYNEQSFMYVFVSVNAKKDKKGIIQYIKNFLQEEIG